MPEPEQSNSMPAADAPQTADAQRDPTAQPPASPPPVREIGGPTGPEPTRFGDWEKAGRCIDF